MNHCETRIWIRPFFALALALLLMLGGARGAAADPAQARPDLAGFNAKIQPLFEQYCTDCHDDSLNKGGLSLETIDADLLAGDDFETWRLIEEQVAFGDMPPAKKLQPSAAERKVLLDWIGAELRKGQWPGRVVREKLALPQFGNYVDHQALFGARLDRVYPAPPRLWRLRPDIYDTIMPRLGERIDGLANGLNEDDGSQFKDYAAGYFLDEAATAPLLGNAKKIADALLSEHSRDREFKRLVDEANPPDGEAVDAAIERMFRKVLGRAASNEERIRFQMFYEKSLLIGGRVPAARALLVAVLMQPEALYRQEVGDGNVDQFGRVRLTQREIAYALSYALANEPINEFIDAAESGKLATNEQVAALVGERLKDDSKLQEKNPRILQFFREYFNYPFANEVFKDQPEGGMHEPGLLVADLETMIRDVLRRDKDVLAELLTTRRYYVNAQYKSVKREGVKLLQGHERKWSYPTAYNLPLDWKWTAERQPVEFPADERAGVLTHPAWLAAWSGNFENHPVQRGKWVRTHLLGGTVPDVPIGVDARVPEAEHTTFRDRLKLATNKAECRRCHRKMDPLGVTFERYDHYGRYQRLDAGQPVDATGAITRTGVSELDGRTVSGPTELMDILAESEHVEQVFIRHAFRFFLGRNETLGDANTLQDAHRAYRESGGSFNAVVASLLSSDSFLLRQPLPQREGGRRNTRTTEHPHD